MDSITVLNERLETHKQEWLATHKTKNKIHSRKHVGIGKGTFVERDLFESSAFISLGGVAPQMLIYFLGKRTFQEPPNRSRSRSRSRSKSFTSICLNEDNLTVSYIELKKLGITQPRATRGFDELLAKGFITIKHHGGGYQKDQNVYALSNQWLLWRKGMVIEKRPKGLKRGFQNAHTR